MEKTIEAFTNEMIKEALNIDSILRIKGYSWNELTEWWNNRVRIISDKKVQEALNINLKLIEKGKSWNELRTWHEQTVKKSNMPVKPCPDCNSVMRLLNEEDFYHWACPKCRLGIPVIQPIAEELKQMEGK